MGLLNEEREQVKAFIRSFHAQDCSGHGIDHIERVVGNAMFIARKEGADLRKVELAAWLHDVDDGKLTSDPPAVRKERWDFLATMGVGGAEIKTIEKIIASVSFSEGKKAVSLEQRVVQDADRLDAIGAIGIARCFSYGAVHAQSLETSVGHFHKKLLRIYDKLWTASAKELAKQRQALMETFVLQMENELSCKGRFENE